jgi:Cu-Zn family superoxide dismutase
MAKSVAVFSSGAEQKEQISGYLKFQQASEDAPTTIAGELEGLPEGKHAIAIHVFGNLSQGYPSLGPHFNPFGKTHGAPEDETRHVGSLGNITVTADGKANVNITDQLVKLIGPQSVIGRSIVVYSGEDDMGKGGHENSLTNGNAGDIIAAGVIGLDG